MGEKREETEKGELLGNRLIDGMPVFAKELIAGGVAGGFAKTVVAPLERLKILFQTRRTEFQSLGLSGSFTKIAKTEGVLGFYRGNGASVARIVPYAALHYMAYEEYRRWIILGFPGTGRGPVLDLMAGSFAGGTAVLFTYPLDLVRTKLAYQASNEMTMSLPLSENCLSLSLSLTHILTHTRRVWTQTPSRAFMMQILVLPLNMIILFPVMSQKLKADLQKIVQVADSSKLNVKGLVPGEQVYKGIRDCFSKTYKEAGIRGLYRGVAPSLYGIFPYAGLKFYFYEEMKRHVPGKHRNDITVKLVCGSVAGLLGQTFTYPLDVARRQMQVQRILRSTNGGDMKSTMETLVMIVRREGWKQLFSGLSINYLKVVPSVAIGFTVYDVMKSFLHVPAREETVVEVGTSRSSQPLSLHSSPSLSESQQ